jgi:DNA-binding HxlR family transcriptional regulator
VKRTIHPKVPPQVENELTSLLKLFGPFAAIVACAGYPS